MGAYLRARRALISPEQAGLPPEVGKRRTPGLRREEVAALAGVSVDYYVRLEKGRDRNPSPQVLAALAEVLQLDQVAADYLQSLSQASLARPRPGGQDEVPSGSRLLLEVIGLPAFVENRYFDVLAANRLATALSPRVRPGANRLRAMFLDEERGLHSDWDNEAAVMVAQFRGLVGTELHDAPVSALVEELSRASDAFAQAWNRHDVDPILGVSTRLDHPDVGQVTLRREGYPVPGGSGQLLVVHFAEPGTEAAQRLGRLAPLDPSSARPDGGL